jgi:hypothetical protein
MSVHIDVLGRLHVLWGTFGVLSGVSLFVLAIGTGLALDDLGASGPAGPAAIGVLVLFGVILTAGGTAALVVGLALGRRRPFARPGALVLAVPHLVLAPFGTALAVYSCWVLLNDDARRAFGRGPIDPPHLVPLDQP